MVGVEPRIGGHTMATYVETIDRNGVCPDVTCSLSRRSIKTESLVPGLRIGLPGWVGLVLVGLAMKGCGVIAVRRASRGLP